MPRTTSRRAGHRREERREVDLPVRYGREPARQYRKTLRQTAGEYRTIARTNPAGQTAGDHRTARSGGFRTRKNGHGIAGRRPSGRGFPGTGFSLAAAGNAARTSRRRHSDGRQTRAAQIRAFRLPHPRRPGLRTCSRRSNKRQAGVPDRPTCSAQAPTKRSTPSRTPTTSSKRSKRSKRCATGSPPSVNSVSTPKPPASTYSATGWSVFRSPSNRTKPGTSRATRKTRKESSTRYARFSKTSESLKSGRTSNSTS